MRHYAPDVVLGGMIARRARTLVFPSCGIPTAVGGWVRDVGQRTPLVVPKHVGVGWDSRV